MYRVRTTFTGLSGGPWLNTLFFTTATAGDTAGATAARDKAANFWGSMETSIAVGVVITTSGEVDFIEPDDGELSSTFSVADVGNAGSSAGDILPRATQGILRLSTNAVADGRRVRGKINVPAPTEGFNITGDTPTTGYRTAMETAGALLLAAPADPALCVWHRPIVNDLGQVTRTGSAVPVTAVTARAYWAILRSRRDG